MQSIREPYRDWAEGHINRIRGILNSSRAEHTQAVKDRIASVEQMKDVVSVTENLFALSKVRDFVRNVRNYLVAEEEAANNPLTDHNKILLVSTLLDQSATMWYE